MNRDYEMMLIDLSIRFGKKSCNLLLFSMITSIAVLIMNFAFWEMGHLTPIGYMACGTMIFNIFWTAMTLSWERHDLRLERERKASYIQFGYEYPKAKGILDEIAKV